MISYIFILVHKILNGVAVVVEVQVDDEAIVKEVHDTLEDAVGKVFFIALLQEFLHAVLA